MPDPKDLTAAGPGARPMPARTVNPLDDIARQAYDIANGKGFYTPPDLAFEPKLLASNADLMLAKMALIFTEINEAEQAYNQWLSVGGVDTAFREELADICIRALSIIGALGKPVRIYFRSPRHETKPDVPPKFFHGCYMVAAWITETARAGEVDLFAERLQTLIDRVFIQGSLCGYDMQAEIEKKVTKNAERPYRHGKKCSV